MNCGLQTLWLQAGTTVSYLIATVDPSNEIFIVEVFMVNKLSLGGLIFYVEYFILSRFFAKSHFNCDLRYTVKNPRNCFVHKKKKFQWPDMWKLRNFLTIANNFNPQSHFIEISPNSPMFFLLQDVTNLQLFFKYNFFLLRNVCHVKHFPAISIHLPITKIEENFGTKLWKLWSLY